LNRGAGVTGYDEGDCLALLREAVGDELPPTRSVARNPAIDVEACTAVGQHCVARRLVPSSESKRTIDVLNPMIDDRASARPYSGSSGYCEAWHPQWWDYRRVSQVEVSYVLLHRTPKGWRTTVAEIPTALACGELKETPGDAPFEVAAAEFEQYVRRHWRVSQQLVWWLFSAKRGSPRHAVTPSLCGETGLGPHDRGV